MSFSSDDGPFHLGELAVQDRLRVREKIASFAKKVLRPFMPDQHRDFFQQQPFMVVAAHDGSGSIWVTLMAAMDGEAGFVQSPEPTKLLLKSRPTAGDALTGALEAGSDVGMLGIEFATKRRNRVNGRVYPVEGLTEEGSSSWWKDSKSGSILEFRVDQSFGNCPQYIKPRRWWSAASKATASESKETSPVDKATSLTPAQVETIAKAETIFFASGYRGEGEDWRFGCDASHRGGKPGFVRIVNDNTLQIPDYSGNNSYNTFGNLELDPRFGVTIPRFETGGMIQLSGRAQVNYDTAHAEKEFGPGALKIVTFNIEHVVDVADGSLPVLFAANDLDASMKPRDLVVTKKTKESEDVTSFVFRPAPGEDPQLWPFQAGQHLPITLHRVGKCNEENCAEQVSTDVDRTYSLSGGPDWGSEYRISVKREVQGTASRHLHDKVQVGDKIQARPPAGDFVLHKDALETRERATVLVSSGVGLTPMVSMLHAFTSGLEKNPFKASSQQKCYFIHGARDGHHHPLRDEVVEVAKLGGESVVTQVSYSKPQEGVDREYYDREGRLSAKVLAEIVPDLKKAEFYLCGPVQFMADIQDGLEQEYGVDPQLIHSEAF